MAHTQAPKDKLNGNQEEISGAYESSLAKLLKKSAQDDTSLHSLLDEDVSEFKQMAQWIKRDLIAAAQHLNESGQELKDWLGFDLKLIKSELWQQFTEATDKTTLELLKLKKIAANAEYHTGEIIGLGTLICDQCNAQLHFYKASHIPPCAKCHGTRFHRLNR
jgi:pyruvate-formate lyase-activating enzyme